MKAENTSTGHNRTVKFTDIRADDARLPAELLVEMVYEPQPGIPVGSLAVVLDKVVIPSILNAVNRQGSLYRDEHLIEASIAALNAFDKVYDAITAIKDMTVLKDTKVARDLQVYMQEMEKVRHAIVVTGRQPDNPVNPAVLRSQLESQD